MADITLVNLSIAKSFAGKVLFERNSAGMLYLIAALERAGLKADFHEHFLVQGTSLQDELDRFLALVGPPAPVVGIGCHSVHLPFVLEAARELKRRFPAVKVVLGGGGPAPLASALCEEFDFIDAVAFGEGEETIVELARRGAKNLAGVAGLAYREGGVVSRGPARPPIRDLDALPLPAYGSMDFGQYEVPTVITSRGCPYGCHFCSLSAFWGKEVRYRSIDSVLRELRLLAGTYGVKYVFFGDATFIMDRERTLELCRRLKAEALGLKWECLVRLDRIDEELMAAMRDAGCEAVFYGLESGSDNVLRRIKSGFDLAGGLAVIKKSAAYFRTVEPGMMWGFPFETLEDFKETLKVRQYLKAELGCEVQVRWLEPYPDTAFFEKYKDRLFLPEKTSAIYRPDALRAGVAGAADFYADAAADRICIPGDVTSVRTVVAASHVAALCGRLIRKYPLLFPDYYRYETPDLDKKLELAGEFCLY
ncbi:MAG: B12-binding domain-containing radical SAM protein [Elusimicrobiales bacterium]|nr:B12-binding domain-containing radical SAM protein [Elusimicrobiales bacterium]